MITLLYQAKLKDLNRLDVFYSQSWHRDKSHTNSQTVVAGTLILIPFAR